MSSDLPCCYAVDLRKLSFQQKQSVHHMSVHQMNLLFSLTAIKEFELLCKNYSVVHTHGQFHACVWHSYVVQPVFRLTFVLHLTYSFLCMFSIRLVRHCIA